MISCRKIEQYLKKIKTIIGPLQIMRSNVGLKLTKFHSLVHLPYFVKEYGAPMNFFEGHLEEFLKHFVKKLYARTTRQHSRYLYDLTCRLKEVQCLDVWEEDNEIFNEFPNQHRNNNETDDCEMNDETHNVNREYYDHEQNISYVDQSSKSYDLKFAIVGILIRITNNHVALSRVRTYHCIILGVTIIFTTKYLQILQKQWMHMRRMMNH